MGGLKNSEVSVFFFHLVERESKKYILLCILPGIVRNSDNRVFGRLHVCFGRQGGKERGWGGGEGRRVEIQLRVAACIVGILFLVLSCYIRVCAVLRRRQRLGGGE